MTQIVSHGQAPAHKGDESGTVVWENRVDYFVKSRENINKVLTAHLNAGGSYPSDEEGFKTILKKAGVDLNDLRDPWVHPYYPVFQRGAQYSDRVNIQRTSSSGERTSQPVTLVREDVRVMSAGPDGKAGTEDDFQVANYSILVSDLSAKDTLPHPAPSGMSLTDNNGALTGTVVDQTGAVIANATVEATLEDSDSKYSAKTDTLAYLIHQS